MSRATGPERRLLAIYTGGTIGMRSEHGSELRRPGEGAAPGAVGGIILELSSPREARGSRTPIPVGRGAFFWREGEDVAGRAWTLAVPSVRRGVWRPRSVCPTPSLGKHSRRQVLRGCEAPH